MAGCASAPPWRRPLNTVSAHLIGSHGNTNTEVFPWIPTSDHTCGSTGVKNVCNRAVHRAVSRGWTVGGVKRHELHQNLSDGGRLGHWSHIES